MSEQWRPAPGYEGFYAVSDQGRVKSLARSVGSRWQSYRRPVRESLLSGVVNPSGYWVVKLSRNGASTNVLVHRLVLLAFVGPCPEGMFGCHNNGDPHDNRLSNLRWDTPTANLDDCVAHGRHQNASKTHCDNGHPFDLANTYMDHRNGRTKRGCRACRRAATDRYRKKENAA